MSFIKKNIFTRALLLAMLFLSSNSFASTICSFDCPSTGGSTGPALPQILELYPVDGSSLFLGTTGLIILDTNIYNNLLNLTIGSSTSVYVGLSSLPSSITIPDVFELSTLAYSGVLEMTGLSNDYVLIRQFSGNTVLNLSAVNGVLVMNTNSLTAVPLPGSIILMLSGFAMLFSLVRRKGKVTQMA